MANVQITCCCPVMRRGQVLETEPSVSIRYEQHDVVGNTQTTSAATLWVRTSSGSQAMLCLEQYKIDRQTQWKYCRSDGDVTMKISVTKSI